MNRRNFVLYTIGLAVFISLISAGAQAQYRAVVQGTVTDPSGAVIPGTTVTLTNKETNFSRTTTSNDNGFYTITNLPPANYTMTAEKEGFKKKVLDNIGVIADQVQGVNVALEVGQASESVTVSADATPAIQTETATISGTVSSREVQKLPSFGRDVFQLTQLAPGAFSDMAQNGSGGTADQPGKQGPGATGATGGIFSTENRPQISVAGQRQDANNITLDGVGITSVSWGGAAVITPNEDSVKEVKIVSNSYDAENGRFGGGQIKIISQNGTNNYHGSFFFKADRPGLNSYQPFTGSANAPRTPLRNEARYNDWGGSVGGPIIKNKLFAFFSYERIRNQSSDIAQGWYETAQLLKSAPAGSLASRYGAFPGEGVSSAAVIDQTCASIGLVEGTNCHEVVGQGLDIGSPLKTALGTKDPTFVNNLQPGVGNGLDGNADIAFYKTQGPRTEKEQQYNGRLDFNATSKDLIAFSIYRVPLSRSTLNGSVRPANIFHHNATNEAETVLWTHTISATLLNEARVNAAGWRWNELKDNPQSPLGLPQTLFIGDQTNGNQIGTACPGCNALGGGAGSIFDQWTYNARDIVTKIHASHNLKFGGELTQLKFVQDAPWSARPQYGFNNYWDFLNDAPVKEVGTFNPTTGVPTDVRKDSRQNLYAFFAQDDWKVRPNLTLNLGMRWEYIGPVTFIHHQLSKVILGQGANVLTGMKMVVGGDLYNAKKTNFGPQLGFAWSPGSIAGHELSQKLVFRGGFGIGYTGTEQAITLNGWPNIPFTVGSTTLTGSNMVYDFPTNPHQFGPYPANSHTILQFDQNNIPIPGQGLAPVGVTGFPWNYPTTYTYHYSLDTQYEFAPNWVATVGYQGALSRHLTRQYNLNEIYGALGYALNPMINDVDWYGQDGNSRLHALLTEVQHRFLHSFLFDVQYRLASSWDNGSGPYTISYYQWNPHADWGASDFDVRHAFKAYGLYSPRFFSGRSWLEKVAGGWSVSGILNAHSGYPFTPVYGGSCDFTYQGGSCKNGSNSQLLPIAYLGGAHTGSSNTNFLTPGGIFPKGGAAYFTPPALNPCTQPFPATCPGQLPTGPGIHRNAFRGPRYFDLDATLTKAFGLPNLPVLGENASIEFRINAYNLLNSLNLTGIDNNLGPITCGAGGCTATSSQTFGQALSALGARTVEMQARFNF